MFSVRTLTIIKNGTEFLMVTYAGLGHKFNVNFNTISVDDD